MPNNTNQVKLSEAVNKRQWDRVLVAVIRGADPEDKKPLGFGHSALHEAIKDGRLDIADALLHLGANPSYKATDHNGKQWAPLHLAVSCDKPKAIERLLSKGASIDVPNEHGSTPLSLAAEFGLTAIVNELLNKGANPNAKDNYGDTALHYAVKRKHVEIIKSLLRHDADPAVANEQGITPLAIAKEQKDHPVMAVLSTAVSSPHRQK